MVFWWYKNLLTRSVLLFLLSVSVISVTDYCKLSCDFGDGQMVKHSACDCNCSSSNNTPFPLQLMLRVKILKWHNYFRNRIAQKRNASNMIVMSYDSNLEFTVACRIFDTATSENDRCRRTQQFARVGQILSTAKVDIDDEGIRSIIETWYNEKSNVDEETISSYPANAEGQNFTFTRYTQLAWAKTSHVGCAATKLQNGEHLFGCNYGPAGNEGEQPVYLRGECVSKCPLSMNKNPKFECLCGNIEQMPPDAYFIGVKEIEDRMSDAPVTRKTNTRPSLLHNVNKQDSYILKNITLHCYNSLLLCIVFYVFYYI